MGIFWIALAGLLWAVDTLIRYPLLGSGISSEKIVFIEHMFLTLIFLPIFFNSITQFKKLKVGDWFSFFMIGVVGSAIATLAFTRAFSMMNPSLVILLQKLQPIVAILYARIFLGERNQKSFWLWCIVCLTGSFLISYEDIMPLLNSHPNNQFLEGKVSAYIYTLVAIFGWGGATIFGKKLINSGLSTTQIMSGRFLLGFVFMLIFMLLSPELLKFDLNYKVWGNILLMVTVSGVMGMYFYYKGLKLIPAKLCTLAELFFPLFAVILNWMVLGAKLTPQQLLGGVLLLIGSTVIQVRRY